MFIYYQRLLKLHNYTNRKKFKMLEILIFDLDIAHLLCQMS